MTVDRDSFIIIISFFLGMFNTPYYILLYSLYYIILYCIIIIQYDIWFGITLQYYITQHIICFSPYYIVLKIELSKDKIYAMTLGPKWGFKVRVGVSGRGRDQASGSVSGSGLGVVVGFWGRGRGRVS